MSTAIGFKKKLALKLFSIVKKNASKTHELKQVFWECTLRCNLNCKHCGSDCKKESGIKDMPLNDFLVVLDQIKTKHNPNQILIVLTGGEPLMRKDIEQCGIEIYKRGFPWGMVSNGMLLNQQKLEKLIRAGLRSLTISLDGLEASHNWLRGNSKSFANCMNSLPFLNHYSKDINFDIVTCVHPGNISELTELKKLLLFHSIKNWRLFSIFPIGRAKANSYLKLDPDQFKSMLEFIKSTRNEGVMNVSYGCEGFLGSYETEVRSNFFFCLAGIHVASVMADGSISACPNLRSNFNQGSIYTHRFIDVWEDKFENMRDRKWTKTGICKNCEVFQYCEGNGLHLHTGPDTEPSFCHYKHLKN